MNEPHLTSPTSGNALPVPDELIEATDRYEDALSARTAALTAYEASLNRGDRYQRLAELNQCHREVRLYWSELQRIRQTVFPC